MYKLEIFKGFQERIIIPSTIIPGIQLKFNCRKRYEKVNTVVPERLVLNSSFLMMKTTSGANSSMKVGKLYSQVCLQNMF